MTNDEKLDLIWRLTFCSADLAHVIGRIGVHSINYSDDYDMLIQDINKVIDSLNYHIDDLEKAKKGKERNPHNQWVL